MSPLLFAAFALLCFGAASAHATPPGTNGKIAFVDGGDIWVMNPDGSAKTQLTSAAETESAPDWSPDGTKIAYDRSFPGSSRRIYVMNADGSDQHLLVTGTFDLGGTAPSWSPDGMRIAYVGAGSRIWTVNADGSSPAALPIDIDSEVELWPLWSPDGAEIAFTWCPHSDLVSCDDPTAYRIGAVPAGGGTHRHLGQNVGLDWSPDDAYFLESWGAGDETFRIERDGTDEEQIYFGAEFASWSPDGARIAVDNWSMNQVVVMDADGSNPTPIAAGRNPDWQSIPVNAYPRPRAASPQHISLVPAYRQCTSANRTHGPPLAFPSCAPPLREPGQLTVGTPDSNGKPAKNVGELWISAMLGNPATPADEADVHIYGQVTDVRLASDLSDYTGSLEAHVNLRITDKNNTPHPGGPGAGSVQDLTYTFPIPCSATADTTVGSACPFDTTADALLAGAVTEGRRSIWELGQLSVHDAGGDVFLRQGVFIP